MFFEGELPDSIVIEENLTINDCLRDSSKESYLSFCDSIIEEAGEHNQRLVEAASDFCYKNKGANTIDVFGKLTYEHYVFTKKHFKNIFKPQREDGWEIFHNLYPHSFGLITLARPGFSNDGTLAVMYIGHQVEYMMGYGRIYVLEKSDNKWIDTKIIIGCEWES